MAKEQSSKETVEQIMRDIGVKFAPKTKKSRKNKRSVESEIDLFATAEEDQYINIKRRTKKQIDE
jgi:hypothetical protein